MGRCEYWKPNDFKNDVLVFIKLSLLVMSKLNQVS